MPLKTTTDEAIDKYRQAKNAHDEAEREVNVARLRLDAAQERARGTGAALTEAHHALIEAVGDLEGDA